MQKDIPDTWLKAQPEVIWTCGLYWLVLFIFSNKDI